MQKAAIPLRPGAAGLTLLEALVAAAVVVLIAVMISDGLVFNLDARAKNERQLKFLQVESALRSTVFRQLSDYMEGTPNCANAGPALRTMWGAAPVKEVRLRVMPSANASRHPPQMARRCSQQSLRGGLTNGIYLCFELRPGTGGRGGFLDQNEAYAEVFYGFWNVQADAATTCARFNDANTPNRGARLYYSIYWRQKAPGARKKDDGKFLTYSGIMYGQSKNK